MAATQTCPRRMSEFGPWERKEGQDEWREEAPGYRTCSFCGSLHPEDFMRLVREHAEIGPTDKSYKIYVPAADAHVRGAGKFYTHHFLQGGGNEFRELVAIGSVNFGYPGHFYTSTYVPETDWPTTASDTSEA